MIQLPAYAPRPQPHGRRLVTRQTFRLGNLAVTGVDQLTAMVNRLKRIQHRPDLLTSFLTHTGLALDAEPP